MFGICLPTSFGHTDAEERCTELQTWQFLCAMISAPIRFR